MQFILFFIVVVFLIYTNSFNNGFRSSYKYRKSGLISIRTNRLQIEMKSSLYGSSSAKNIEHIRGPKATIVRAIKKVFGSTLKFAQFVINKILSVPKFIIKTIKGESTWSTSSSSSSSLSSSGIKSNIENSMRIEVDENRMNVNVNVNEKNDDVNMRVVPVSRVARTPHEMREIERAKKIVESKLKEIEQSIETAKVTPMTTISTSTSTTLKTGPDPVVTEVTEVSVAPTKLAKLTEVTTTEIEPEIEKREVITDAIVTGTDATKDVRILEADTDTDTDIDTDTDTDAKGVMMEEVNEEIDTTTTVMAAATVRNPNPSTVANEGGILDSLEFGPVNPLSVVGSYTDSSNNNDNNGGGSISMEKVKAAGVSGIISYVGTEVVFWAFSLPLVISAYHSSTGEWLSISNTLDRGRIFALSATFVTAIRLAVPLRLGVAVALTPWVEDNVTKRYLLSSDDDDNQKFTVNFNAILQDLKYSSETASRYLKELVQDLDNSNDTDRNLVNDGEMEIEVEKVQKQEEVEV